MKDSLHPSAFERPSVRERDPMERTQWEFTGQKQAERHHPQEEACWGTRQMQFIPRL